MTTTLNCAGCAHWTRLSAYRGECRLTGHRSKTYRQIGTAQSGLIFEETKPDHWCILHAPLVSPGATE